MKIVIDRAIPFIKGLFEPYAEVLYLSGGEFMSEDVADADALIIRTRTRCDEALLSGSSVKHIATATIGYDHIDLDYCRKNGIRVTTAQGCNARGVLQWIGASLALLSRIEGWSPEERTLGVVGVGNVGRLIKEYASLWGFRVLCCDPPRRESEGIEEFVSLEELLPEVDILTLHTPLNDTTRELINKHSIKLLKPNAVILNSSRGEVVESKSLVDNPSYRLLLDVWEDEPHIDSTLLDRAIVATPHIAGYSLQGKANGTAMVVRDIAQHFNLPLKDWYPEVKENRGERIEWSEMCRTISKYFDIEAESHTLKNEPNKFEELRNCYDYRSEYF